MTVRSLYALTRLPASDPPSMSSRVAARLAGMEDGEKDPWLQGDYRQALLTVLYAANGSPIPFVEASYKVFWTHPDRVWEKIAAWRKAKLGQEYTRFYDEAGNVSPQWLEIPDYDPADGPPHLPAKQEPSAAPLNRWPKAPLRRVVNRTEVVGSKGRVIYHLEELECGHSHTEFPDANPPRPRRRCPECQAIGQEASHANVVETSSPRRPEPLTGNLYALPKPPRSTKQEPVRELPRPSAASGSN